MHDLSFMLIWIGMFGVSFLSSAVPIVGRLLVQSSFAQIALAIAIGLSGFSLFMTVAHLNEMTALQMLYTVAGVAPLHQLLLFRHLYGRFIEKHGRTPQSASRFSPQADRAFASTNMLLGALPYLVLASVIAYLAKQGS
jgi:hypothetical protein